MKLHMNKYRNDLPIGSEFVLGLLTGAVLGVTAGVLLAPRSGKDTRKKIAGAFDDQVNNLDEYWDTTKSQVKQTVNDVKKSVGRATDKVEDGLSDFADKARGTADRFQDKADELADDAKSAVNRAKDNLQNR
ncbi:hypothetical protein BN8_02436 [Fibrisoma limi BUZ 3]|uniref:Gas vesicle protein n=1 Tax=Fibrisoma limi BUZ 3 TaxID=1185876 RepID=I2GHH1_9BACT|nr:YtxH domain-containing protein [Fibrisoma limi]CCH53346.1 hypothetical protein BN8_02436 [Fibrisoma limi BUZ 3]